MIGLQRLHTFVAVVEAASFTAAAAALGQSKARVSFNIKQLEAELGVALLTRNTRRIVVTDAGQRFYHNCLGVLQLASEAVDEVRKDHGELSGTLRITTTAEYGSHIVVPALTAFARKNPRLQIQHASSPLLADLVSERFDLAIRLGQLQDSSYKASLIATFQILAVAAPIYLDSFPVGSRASPEALSGMRWLKHGRLPAPLCWQVQPLQGPPLLIEIKTPVTITSDSVDALREFALSGAGVALLPEWLVREDIRAGRLLALLPDYRFLEQGVYAVYPNTQHVPEKVRAFIDFLKKFVGA